MKQVKEARKQARSATHFTVAVAWLPSPTTTPAAPGAGELLTHAPISEPSAMHSDASVVAAEMLSEITPSASADSSGAAACKKPLQSFVN
uniref:Uncharacterized protein n=1 Tax=Oryza glumipatula TaxID=40148 RepID=A0A0E0B1G5_9ORYZ